MDQVQIQFQDLTGNWMTVRITQNNSQMIIMAMRDVKQIYPDKRVRAVDADGRLLDMLI